MGNGLRCASHGFWLTRSGGGGLRGRLRAVALGRGLLQTLPAVEALGRALVAVRAFDLFLFGLDLVGLDLAEPIGFGHALEHDRRMRLATEGERLRAPLVMLVAGEAPAVLHERVVLVQLVVEVHERLVGRERLGLADAGAGRVAAEEDVLALLAGLDRSFDLAERLSDREVALALHLDLVREQCRVGGLGIERLDDRERVRQRDGVNEVAYMQAAAASSRDAGRILTRLERRALDLHLCGAAPLTAALGVAVLVGENLPTLEHVLHDTLFCLLCL